MRLGDVCNPAIGGAGEVPQPACVILGAVVVGPALAPGQTVDGPAKRLNLVLALSIGGCVLVELRAVALDGDAGDRIFGTQ